MITNQSIIEAIERHCEVTKMSVVTFGGKVANDGKLIKRLRDGKTISIDTYNRIMNFIEAAQTSREAAE